MRARRLAAVAVLVHDSHGMALFSKFRGLCPQLLVEWVQYLAAHGLVPLDSAEGHADALGNSARRHHVAVSGFCRKRRRGCSWAQYHALIDHSREPYAGVFDAERLPAGAIPRDATSCRRLHAPTAEQLLELVHGSTPAVLTGLLDGWPALRRWDQAYLTKVSACAREA